jgi:hypothetical protein
LRAGRYYLRLPAFRFPYFFVARMSKATSGMDIEASRPYPHIAPLMRATDV